MGPVLRERSAVLRRLGLAMIVTSALVVSAWGATAGAYSIPNIPTVSTSQSTVDPCGVISITAAAYQPNEQVTLTLDNTSTVLGTATTDANGNLSTTVKIPTGTSDGPHTVVATGTSGDSSTTAIDVEGSCPAVLTASSTSSTPPASGLAFTGADIALMVTVAAAALGVGGLLLLATRRRRVPN
jgi:hypothetical protein